MRDGFAAVRRADLRQEDKLAALSGKGRTGSHRWWQVNWGWSGGWDRKVPKGGQREHQEGLGSSRVLSEARVTLGSLAGTTGAAIIVEDTGGKAGPGLAPKRHQNAGSSDISRVDRIPVREAAPGSCCVCVEGEPDPPRGPHKQPDISGN